jgi:GT2 family glycosyltransferase
VKRAVALGLGGFDENFVHVAYRFEAEFCDRALSAGERIVFEPGASIRHLRVASGGTRSYGEHLTTVKPSHAVGAYYYLLRARRVRHRFGAILWRMIRSVRTRHHLRHPWWIPGTLFAELWGLLWALRLYFGGPRLLGCRAQTRGRDD